jgi:peptide/nickel transport system permease protein
MVTAALRRVGQLVIVLFLVTFFTAMLVNLLPGDVATTIVPFGSDEQRAEVREDLGLDDPIYVQYGRWVGDFVTGDFGSFYRRSNTTEVADRVSDAAPVSLQLMVYAQVLALAVAIPLGVLTAYRAGTIFDRLANVSAFGLLAIPNFVLALVLAYVVGVELAWLPPQGYVKPSDDLVEHFRSMVLPAVSLAVGQIAVYMRLLRSDMVATLQEDFVLMAKAKGLSSQRVLWRHALRPSSLTLLTVAGLNVGTLIGGALIIEVIFSLDGMGFLLFDAIQSQQIVAIQSLVAIITIAYVFVNVIVDVLYAVLDPRIRHARG